MDIDLKDKVPPHNLDAEQAALGALLIDWNALSDVPFGQILFISKSGNL